MRCSEVLGRASATSRTSSAVTTCPLPPCRRGCPPRRGLSRRDPRGRPSTLVPVKALVTGGAGYIGSVVTHALTAAGHDVVVLDDLSTGFADNIPPGAEFVRLPVHEVATVLTPGAGFDAVLHFAGKIEVAESVARPDMYWNVNVAGTMALLG